MAEKWALNKFETDLFIKLAQEHYSHFTILEIEPVAISICRAIIPNNTDIRNTIIDFIKEWYSDTNSILVKLLNESEMIKKPHLKKETINA
jgi:hypothetical protein